MRLSELTLCANRADVLKRRIRSAKGAVSAQRPGIVELAIREAEWIAERLRAL